MEANIDAVGVLKGVNWKDKKGEVEKGRLNLPFEFIYEFVYFNVYFSLWEDGCKR